MRYSAGMAALLYSLIVALVLVFAIGAIGLESVAARNHQQPSSPAPRFAGVPTFSLELLEKPRSR
jgi:flagellar basal body-associated protein FliL